MKTYNIVLFFVLTFLTVYTHAQDKHRHCNEDRQRIKSEKVAFITDHLDLSVAEAQVFWPLYNEFTNKADEFFDEEREIKRELRFNRDNLSESELNAKIDRLIELAVERAMLEKEYHNKYKGVLSASKIVLLYEAEFGFKRQLLRKYKNHNCPMDE
jgi:predicted nuclease with TOPRIM domain